MNFFGTTPVVCFPVTNRYLSSSPVISHTLNLISFHGAGSRFGAPLAFSAALTWPSAFPASPPHTVIPWLSPLMWLQENPQKHVNVWKWLPPPGSKNHMVFFQNLFWKTPQSFSNCGSLPLQGINISHLGKRKIIDSKYPFLGGYVSSLEGIILDVPWFFHFTFSESPVPHC